MQSPAQPGKKDPLQRNLTKINSLLIISLIFTIDHGVNFIGI